MGSPCLLYTSDAADEEANGIDATGRSDIGGGGEAELSGSLPSPPEVHLPTSADVAVEMGPLRGFAADEWEFAAATIMWHEHLGAGSFGEVHRVTRGGLEMAAKQVFVHGAARAEAEKVLRREFRAAHGLVHQNIVKLVGVCVDNPSWVCLLMELVPRGSLRKLLDAAPEKVTGSEAMQLKLARGIALSLIHI